MDELSLGISMAPHVRHLAGDQLTFCKKTAVLFVIQFGYGL